MSYGMSDDEHEALARDTEVVGWIAYRWLWIFAGSVIAAVLIWALFIRPAVMEAESRANRSSSQYVEAQRTFLLQKLTACQQLDTEIHTLEQNDTDPDLLAGKQAQRKAFIAEMRQRVALIQDKSAVPAEVTAYLNTHKQ